MGKIVTHELSPEAQQVKQWYLAYADEFGHGDKNMADAMAIKRGHTVRVMAEIQDIAASLNVSARIAACSEVAALLHDVGRFEQFRRFGTFADRRSADHAALSLDVITEKHVIDFMQNSEQEMVREAVRWHNRQGVSDDLTGGAAQLCRMVRDADKLDIYRVVLGQYENPLAGREETIVLGIPDLDGFTESVIEQVLAGRIVSYNTITRLNDFKALQLGWVYDINFRRSFERIRERGYLARIYKAMPDIPDARRIYERVNAFLEEQCQ